MNRSHYRPSNFRDSYYNVPAGRSEFTNTEYRTIYYPAQSASQARVSSAPYQSRTVQSYKNVSIGGSLKLKFSTLSAVNMQNIIGFKPLVGYNYIYI